MAPDMLADTLTILSCRKPRALFGTVCVTGWTKEIQPKPVTEEDL